jgi:uncharacterized cupin superfamily protein
MTDDSTSVAAAGAALHGVATRDLEDWGPLAEATGAPMQTRGVQLWAGDGDTESGIWECTPGPSAWHLEQHEMVVILSGRMTVTDAAGTRTDLAAGDCMLFPRGWSGTWDIHETVRKAYVLFDS